MGSENAAFRYSGSMMAFVYATNALYPENEEAYWEIRESLREEVKAEWGAAGKWWAQYDGPVAEAYDKGEMCIRDRCMAGSSCFLKQEMLHSV